MDIANVKLGFNVKCGISVSLHLAIFSGLLQVPGKVYTGGHALNKKSFASCNSKTEVIISSNVQKVDKQHLSLYQKDQVLQDLEIFLLAIPST